jgi:HlyD family secretion protein
MEEKMKMQLSFMKKLKGPISKKKVTIGIVLVFIVIASVILYKSKIIQNKFTKKTNVTQRTAQVEKGSVAVTVTGSGPLTYSKTTNAITKVAGTITKLYFKEGDTVKAGDLLAEIDNKDALQTVTDKENSLNQTVLSNSLNTTSEKDLIVKAPISGQVSDIKVISGQAVQKSAQVLTVIDNSKLKLTVRFNTADASKISVGQVADVYIPSLMQNAKAIVTYKNNQAEGTTTGGQLIKVELTLDNPGALIAGINASADVETSSGTVSSVEAAALENINKQTVLTNASGTVNEILVKDGQKVEANTVLVKLKNDDIAVNNQLTQMKIDNSASQLDLAKKQLDDYRIYASIDGTITKQTLNVGDNIKANETIATITDTNQIQFDIPIDELDIAKIAVGQKVKVTIDALTETTAAPLEALVDKVPLSGTSSNGVATFNVTVKLTKVSNKLKSGMNASGIIEVSNVENVLRVPIEAVTKVSNKAFVWVKSDGTNQPSANGNKPSMPNGSNATPSTDSRPSGASGDTASGNGIRQNGGNGGNRQQGSNGQSSQGGGNAQRQNYGGNSNASGGNNTANQASNNTKAASNTSSANNYYANAVRKEVELGANNDSYIEIKSGLNQGETIILPQLQTSSSSSSSSTQRTATSGLTGGFGGGGIPGGGAAPGGGRN